jgi:ferric iron reductase protein FhuF
MNALRDTIRDSSDLVRRLDALTVDTFARFSGSIASRDDARPAISADALLDAGMQRMISDRFRGRFAFFDERAVHSIWMRWYLHVLVPPFLLADILLDWTLPVALEDVRFIVGADARIEAVKLLNAGQNTGGVEPFLRFRELIFGHLAPLVEMLAERTSVTRRVYWSNVGDEFEAMLRRIEQIVGRLPRLLEAQDILEKRTWLSDRANPLFGAVIYKSVNPNPRVRRICCLQYLLPDRRFCSACPVTCRSEK